jgi:hypothetical protein
MCFLSIYFFSIINNERKSIRRISLRFCICLLIITLIIEFKMPEGAAIAAPSGESSPELVHINNNTTIGVDIGRAIVTQRQDYMDVLAACIRWN